MRLKLFCVAFLVLAANVGAPQALAAGVELRPGEPDLASEPTGVPPEASPRKSPEQPKNRNGEHADQCGSWQRELPINPAAPLQLGLKTYPRTLKLHDREVVLTFDDGPDRETTPWVLKALKDACAHATFFLIGRHTAANPDLARQELADGHTVGHHSFSHPSFTMRGFDTASAERDIEAGVEADEKTIYGAEAKSAQNPHVPFFRFPGFADTPALVAFLDQRHYAVFGTDLWAADWLNMTPEHELRRVIGLLEAAPHHNGIILFHDTRRSTMVMLPDFLRELRARHYTIAHLVYAPDAPPPLLTAPLKGWSAETERIIAHLRVPIVPGAHHETEPPGMIGQEPGAEDMPP